MFYCHGCRVVATTLIVIVQNNTRPCMGAVMCINRKTTNLAGKYKPALADRHIWFSFLEVKCSNPSPHTM